MTRATTFSLLLGIGLSAVAPVAFAQVATVRGKVLDEAGAPIADVKLEMEYKGESRVKVVKSTVTDKKGGYVRSGLPGGNFRMTFTKEGYKTFTMDTYISLGSFSEIPDTVLHPGPAAAAASGKPAPPIEAVLPADVESPKAGKTYTAGMEAVKAGRLDEAETLFKEVIEKFPDLAGAHYNLAYVYQQKKDWKSAEAEYVRVAELQPTRSDAVIALSACRELDGRGPEAIEGLLKAAPAFEQDARFLYALGLTASNTGRTKESGDAFRKLQALDPANPESYFHLGTMLVGENKVPEAVAQLEKYVSMTGQDPHNIEIAKGLLLALKKK